MITRVAVVLFGLMTSVLVVAVVVLLALPTATPLPDVYGFRGFGVLYAAVVTNLGAAIALRQPRNRVGWLFLVSGLFSVLLEAAVEYSAYASAEGSGTLPGVEWAIWLTELALPFAIGPILTYLLLVFPTGELSSARWRPVAWYTVFAVVGWAAAGTLLFTSVGYADASSTPNPISLGFALSLDEGGRTLVKQILIGPAAVLCAAAFLDRFRNSRGVERQQLKWVAYAAVIVITPLVFGVTSLLPDASVRKLVEQAKQLATLAFPLAAGIAILRYRLYDIDLLIRGTVIYAAVSAVLVTAYVGGVALFQFLLAPLTAGSGLAVAISTLAVATLFQPVRRRIQAAVDRRFYRSHYDAARTLDSFAVRLRDEVDLDAVRSDLLASVQETMSPDHTSLWLRARAR